MKKEKLTQKEKFKDAARELETDDDEKRFDKTLGKIARSLKEGANDPGHKNKKWNHHNSFWDH